MNQQNHIKIILTLFALTVIFAFPLPGNASETLEKLVLEKKFDEAEAYCAQLKGKNRIQGYRLLGNSYYNEKKMEKACDAYTKSGDFGIIDEMADTCLEQKEYEKAGNCFAKSRLTGKRAAAFEKIADELSLAGNIKAAKRFTRAALDDYAAIIKSFRFPLHDRYFDGYKRCVEKYERFALLPNELKEKKFLQKVLNGTSAYCDKMLKWSFHFFCKEELKEMRDYSRETRRRVRRVTVGVAVDRFSRPKENTQVYEYQLIREGKKISETRNLIQYNGKKKDKKDVKLDTHGYQYKQLIFGPLAMFSKAWQPHFHYRVLHKETIWGVPAVVVDVLPLRRFKENPLFGKAWISLKDYSVLRIQWEPRSLPFANFITSRANKYKAIPSIEFYAEFNLVKRGIRFPSKYYLEESYFSQLSKFHFRGNSNKGRKFLRLKQEVTLKDYMFFIVGSEVVNVKGEGE